MCLLRPIKQSSFPSKQNFNKPLFLIQGYILFDDNN